MGPEVGLLEVCDVDGETQVYSGIRVKYWGSIPVRAVRTEKCEPFIEFCQIAEAFEPVVERTKR